MDETSSDKTGAPAPDKDDTSNTNPARTASRPRDDRKSRDDRESRDDRGRPPRQETRATAPTHDLSRTQNAPRRKHGTRVIFNFTCSSCNTASSLDYRPKVGLDAILCENCMQEADNSDRWKIVREKKVFETKLREWDYTCIECGRTEIRTRSVKDPYSFLCMRCVQEQAIPDRSRLAGAENIDGLVKVRRRKVVPVATSEEE